MTDIELVVAIRALRKALTERHDIVDVGAADEHPEQAPNWAMKATDLLDEIDLLRSEALS